MLYDKDKELYDFFKKGGLFNEVTKGKNKEIEIEIEGNLEDLLTEEELKQLEEDEYLDGGPGYIPTWSSCYKPKDTDKK